MEALKKCVRIALLLSTLGVGRIAEAYPDFVAFGYSSCIVCHYNSAGGGPLTDYGRALWASEIAARPFWTKKTDEQLGESAGFWGRIDAGPDWLKPYAKYRGLQYISNLGSSNSQQRWINMQADLGATILLDANAKWILSGAIGFVPVPSGASPSRPEESRTLISREYYVRSQISSSSWIYLGLLDKPFGLRIADHTSFSRRLTETAQNDQAHGLMWYRKSEGSDLFLNVFAGNLEQKAELQKAGGTLAYEASVSERWKLGGAAGYAANKFVSKSQAAITSRLQVNPRDSLMLETGFVYTSPVTGGDATKSAYGLVRGMMQLARGYHFLSQAEAQRDGIDVGGPTNLRWGLGFLMFPFQRVELQTQYSIGRSVRREGGSEDAQSLLFQVHLSL